MMPITSFVPLLLAIVAPQEPTDVPRDRSPDPAMLLSDTEERNGLRYRKGAPAPFSGTVQARHPNGRMRLRYAVKAGRADGAWSEWFENGTVRLYAEWRAGLGHGTWVYFHPNGEIRERAQVVEDIWHGVAEGWHENGAKAFTADFVRNIRPSHARRWNTGGVAEGPWVDLAGGTSPKAIVMSGWPAAPAQFDFALSPDLETLFVSTVSADGADRRIVVRRWRNNAWTAPEPAPFGDPAASDGSPVMSFDGRHVYFSSDRHRASEPANRHRDLYRASAASGWRTVERVTNTPAYGEVSVGFSNAGVGALWTDRRLDGEPKMSLYEATLEPIDASVAPRLTVGAPLNDLHPNDTGNENDPAVSADGRFMIFANSNLGGRRSGEDLYVTYKKPNGWSRPVPLSLVNTDGGETSPRIIDEGRTLAWRFSDATRSEIRVISLIEALRK